MNHRSARPPIMAVLAAAALILAGCAPAGPQKTNEDLIAADKAFSALSAKQGPKAAYQAFLTDDAKLLNQYRTGSAGIQDQFIQLPADATLTWEPSYVEVSGDGDLGYIWGRYTMLLPKLGHGGRPFMQMGYYTSVWKRKMGSWKVVLLATNPDGQK